MTILKGSDDQMVPESASGALCNTSGGTVTVQENLAPKILDVSLPGTSSIGIPDFDKLLAGLTSPILTSPPSSSTTSFSLSTCVDLDSQIPSSESQDSATRSLTPAALTPATSETDIARSSSRTILPSIHDTLDDMETIYTDRSFYDDYNIKKEPTDCSAEQIPPAELTTLKPAVGLAAVGFTSQGYSATSQLPSPYMPAPEDMTYPSYSYYNSVNSAHNLYPVSASIQPLESTYGDVAFASSGAPTPYIDIEGMSCENDLEKIQEKIDYASAALGIPKDPQQWTSEQSHRWAEYILSQYNFPSSNIADFYMTGSAMCTLSLEDFQKKCSYYGDYLHAELDIWKNSYLVGTASTGSSSNISSSEDEDSCRDFDQMPTSTSTFPVVSQTDSSRLYPTSTVAGIPTPVITPISQPSASLTSTPLLSMSNTPWRDPMLMQVPVSRMTAGCGMGGVLTSNSVSPTPGITSTQLNWRDETHEDMAGLIGSSCEAPVGRGKHAIHLWQFLKELLHQPHQYHNCIRWLDRTKGIFKIEDSSRVAVLWGRRKNRPAMNYDKLSRSIRQYYKKGIIKKTEHSKRLVYQFQPQYR